MSRLPALPLAILTLAAGAACARPSVDLDEARAALISTDLEWSRATKEPDKFVAFFADNASMYAPGMPVVTGGDAIRTAYTEMSRAPGFSLTWVPSKAEVSASGDLGYTAGAYEMASGGVIEKGKYVTSWKKQTDGTWKVAEDIFNADAAPRPPAGTHVEVNPNTLKWGDPPPGLPPGMRSAVVAGDPTQAQPYVLRALVPANYRIPPHWHPTVENITVLSGTVALGMGDTFDDKALQDLPAGGFASVPAEMRHFFVSRTPATIQVHGFGPFGITYFNAADDPRTRKRN